MVQIKDPRQKLLFDPFEHLFSPLAYKAIMTLPTKVENFAFLVIARR